MKWYGRQPITVDTCPGPMNPSSRTSGESRMALIAGMIVTWLQNTEKFVNPSEAARSIVIAVDGAVVSNPIAMKTTCRSGFCLAIFSESSGEYTIRMSVPAAFASKKEPADPGTRIMSPNEVMITSGGAAGAVHQGDGLRQVVLEAVLVDGVRVPAAHLHELVGAARLAERRYLRGERVSLVRVTEFVNEPHRHPRPLCRAIRSVTHAVPRSRPRRPGRCPRGTPWPRPPRPRRSWTARSRRGSAPTRLALAGRPTAARC